MTKLPNLELIEYIAKLYLANDEGFIEKAISLNFQKNQIYFEFDIDVFPQIWGSTCTGFDVMPDGSPAWGGDAMTKEYTTVLHEIKTDVYVVFFGNKPAYAVYNANEYFQADLKKHKIASVSKAQKIY